MKKNEFTFIDLFAGIGGFRLALESIGGQCVFSSEINEHAIEMYKANFNDDPTCDITKLDTKDIPDFDVLCAGFPCQSFSICGRQKGFEDLTRGTLFFDICRILNKKKPKAFILENVQHLEKHDKGNTLYVMINSLNKLGYSVSYKVLNAKDFGVPQNRERILIVGNREGKVFDFSKVKTHQVKSMYEFLDSEGEFEFLNEKDYTLLNDAQIKTQKKSGLIFAGYRNKKIRTIGVREGTEHLSRVHKQPNRIYSADGIHPTLASQEQSGRYWILVNGQVRKLTIDECYRFMGIPKSFKRIGIKSKQYERVGNSVCVPMVVEVGKELVNQFIGEGDNTMDVEVCLESIYREALNVKDESLLNLNSQQREWVKSIIEKEETLKAVYTVLITSLVYKTLNPEQDVRMHQKSLENGYSGRTFDTKYITPFLKQKKFASAMKESGWLTRSLEQNIPYTLDFPGKINNKKVKDAFLRILNDIQENGADAKEYVKSFFYYSIKAKDTKAVVIINPIESETKLNINEIIDLLNKHFNYRYKSRGASILPVVALYSIYECIVKELKRFENKHLQDIASHYSSDRSSGNTGDIVVLDENDKLYEVVEVKFDIVPDLIMLEDAYNKFKASSIQRYYILSTYSAKDEELEKIAKRIEEIKNEHGCQVIINGVMPTLKYYLRLLSSSDEFVNRYTENLHKHPEINAEHKLSWNSIIK